MRLHQGHRSGHGAEQLVGDGFGLGRRRRGDRTGRRNRRRGRGRSRMAVSCQLQETGETGMRRDDLAVAALEEQAPFPRDRLWILEVLLEEIAREARVQAVDVSHYVLCSNATCYQRGWLVITATASPIAKQAAPIETAYVASRSLRPPIPAATNESRIAKGMSLSGR